MMGSPEPLDSPPSDTGEPIALLYHMPSEPDIDMAFANVIQTTFGGDFFMLTLGQAAPQVLSTPEEIEDARKRPRDVRVVARVAIPMKAFLAQIAAINELLERLEKRGLIRVVDEEDVEGANG